MNPAPGFRVIILHWPTYDERGLIIVIVARVILCI